MPADDRRDDDEHDHDHDGADSDEVGPVSAVPDRRDGPLAPDTCPVCATPVAGLMERCPECGLDLAGVPPRPSAYSRTAVVSTIVGFLVVYAVIVLAVALVN